MSSTALEETAVESNDRSTTLTVIVERAYANWCAYTPDDIGVVVATGATREAAIASFRSALKFHLESMRDEGLPTPDVTQLEVRETLAA